MLSIIVAKSKNNIIGKNNQLLWNLPDDLKRFRKITENHTIIMGRKTFESIGKVLPNRKHVIMTHNTDFKVDNPNVEIAHDIYDLKEYINSEEECFVIGGAMIYNLLMPNVERMYVTEIDKEFQGDSFFPKINSDDWVVVSEDEGPEDGINHFTYRYVIYKRK